MIAHTRTRWAWPEGELMTPRQMALVYRTDRMWRGVRRWLLNPKSCSHYGFKTGIERSRDRQRVTKIERWR